MAVAERTDWRIAECAEALGVDTTCIQSVYNEPGNPEPMCLWSPIPGQTSSIMGARFVRGRDGILICTWKGVVG